MLSDEMTKVDSKSEKISAFRKDLKYYLYYQNTRLNPLPDNKILDWSKLKQIADEILKCI